MSDGDARVRLPAPQRPLDDAPSGQRGDATTTRPADAAEQRGRAGQHGRPGQPGQTFLIGGRRIDLPPASDEPYDWFTAPDTRPGPTTAPEPVPDRVPDPMPSPTPGAAPGPAFDGAAFDGAAFDGAAFDGAAFDGTPDASPAGFSDLPPRDPVRQRVGRGPRQQMNIAVCVFAALGMLVVLLHRDLPDTMGLGSLIDMTVPWMFAPLLVLCLWALLLRTWPAIALSLVAVLVWSGADGRMLLPRGPGGVPDVRIVSQNISTHDPNLAAVMRLAAGHDADVLALQDFTGAVTGSAAAGELNARYRYHVVMYEFGVWSRFPMGAATPIVVGSGGDATIYALRVVLTTPKGQLTLYVVHLPPPTVSHDGFATQRDAALAGLLDVLRGDHAARVAVAGDLNIASTDRQLSRLEGGGIDLRSAQAAAGSGFGFTWPSGFPLVRLDDVLVRGITPLRASVLGQTGGSGAHRPIMVDLRLS
jgi:vancomycin resistance protein VanJ